MTEAPADRGPPRSSKTTTVVVGGLVAAATLACALLAWRALGPPAAPAPPPPLAAGAASAPAPSQPDAPPPPSSPSASAAPPRASAAASAPAPHRAPQVSFLDALTSETCPLPCAGGIACAAEDTRECTSGFTCIAGERTEPLPKAEAWSLYLSAVMLEGARRTCNGKGSALAKGSVCFVPASSKSRTCVPIADACAHKDRGTVAVDLMTEDLTRDALTVEVTNAAGRVVASRSGRAFPDGLRRSALCIGARLRDFESASEAGPEVESVTFFLAPAGASLPSSSPPARHAE